MEPQIILTGSQMAQVDAKCIAGGIDSKWLMQNAGVSVSKAVQADFSSMAPGKKIIGAIICGSGNNGGDGFVASIDLIKSGMEVSVFYTGPPEKFSVDGLFYFKKLTALKKAEVCHLDFDNPEEKLNFENKINAADFIIDAIFGTGIHDKQIYGQAKLLIEALNILIENRKKNKAAVSPLVYSVDIPSGVDSDSGEVLGAAVNADRTITFGCKKLGTVIYPGRKHAGDIEVADIGIPQKYLSGYKNFFEADLEWVASKIPGRTPWTYKHACGRLLVIAGSLGFTGAAVMTSQAALRAGAGIVTLVCPWELNSIFEIKLTEVMTYPVEQTDEVSLHMESFDEIEKFSENYDALAIGPGLSRNPSTVCLVREILRQIKKPTVLDADGLRAMYGPMELEAENSLDLSHVVITPHAGELASVLGREKISLKDRLSCNLDVVKKYGVVSVLKGASTIITGPQMQTFINLTGGWALATAGTGDILTGITGAMLAQGMGMADAAVCGAFIHGLASDIMTKTTSRTSQKATDLLEGIQKVFLEIEKIKY